MLRASPGDEQRRISLSDEVTKRTNYPLHLLCLRVSRPHWCERRRARGLHYGAPLRLVAPGRACFYSVKWVNRLEVLAEEAPTTGETIARNRLQR
jgi:hypothetical protein